MEASEAVGRRHHTRVSPGGQTYPEHQRDLSLPPEGYQARFTTVAPFFSSYVSGLVADKTPSPQEGLSKALWEIDVIKNISLVA